MLADKHCLVTGSDIHESNGWRCRCYAALLLMVIMGPSGFGATARELCNIFGVLMILQYIGGLPWTSSPGSNLTLLLPLIPTRAPATCPKTLRFFRGIRFFSRLRPG